MEMHSPNLTRIADLGNELVGCSLNCDGITNVPEKGIIPRTLIPESRDGKRCSIVVGLNPGKCGEPERDYYLRNSCSYDSTIEYFTKTQLHDKPYFRRTREFISLLGFDGDILWTNLVKCECSGPNGIIPIQTMRVCINKFLRREIEGLDSNVIFALGKVAFEFCALSFTKQFVAGLPHPTGSHGDFLKLRTKVNEHRQEYLEALSLGKDRNENLLALWLPSI